MGTFIQSPLLAWNPPGRLGWLATEPSHPPASTPSTGELGAAFAATPIFFFLMCVQVLLLERSGPADAVISRTAQLFLQSNCLRCCFGFLEVPAVRLPGGWLASFSLVSCSSAVLGLHRHWLCCRVVLNLTLGSSLRAPRHYSK